MTFKDEYYSDPLNLEAAKIILIAWESLSAEDFGWIISFAIKITKVSDDELAKAFDISRHCIKRWRDGKCSPHKFMKQHIVNFFLDKINKP